MALTLKGLELVQPTFSMRFLLTVSRPYGFTFLPASCGQGLNLAVIADAP